MMCKNLGITFSPADLDLPTLEAFSTIYAKIDDVNSKKNKR